MTCRWLDADRNGFREELCESSIAVSYAWSEASVRIVEELEVAFSKRGIRIVRDKIDLDYKGSIEAFEKRIGRSQFVILVVSDKFLRSPHCMHELLEIDRNRDMRRRVFPIVLPDALIYEALDRLQYIKYWDEQIEKLDEGIKKTKLVDHLSSIFAALERYMDIRRSFDGLVALLADMNALTLEAHAEKDFSELVSHLENAMPASGVLSDKSEPAGDGKIRVQASPTVPETLLRGHYFVSYSLRDVLYFAETLYDTLIAEGIVLWMDIRDAKGPDGDREQQVINAIKTCAGLVLVGAGERTWTNPNCERECRLALRYKKVIVPVLTSPELRLPQWLEGRQKVVIDSRASTAALNDGFSRLGRHLRWLATSEGRLQSLKERRFDAERDVQRQKDFLARRRIQEDIALLDEEIRSQRVAIEKPENMSSRLQERISLGLARVNEQPCDAFPLTHNGGVGRIVESPPIVVPSYFQDRHIETQLIGDFLKDRGRCLMTVSGRGGIGKTALVCHALNRARQQAKKRGGVFDIVYLSANGTRQINFPNFFAGLSCLLPPDKEEALRNVYLERQATVEDKVTALLAEFPFGGVSTGDTWERGDGGGPVVILDNFEDMVDVESRQILDKGIASVIHALLTAPPHNVKVVITTRVVPSNLPLTRPERYLPFPLDHGLESPYAEEILRQMDLTGNIGLKHASDALLREAQVRTRGYPKALEALFAILATDRDSDLESILEATEELLPESVMEVLVGEAFSRLDISAQIVMQSLAVYGRPVASTAVDFMLTSCARALDAKSVLGRLVNMQFVKKEGGKYYLHPVDRDYALSRLLRKAPSGNTVGNENPYSTDRISLSRLGADYFRRARPPRSEWKSLEDMESHIAEIGLRCESEDTDAAAAILVEIDFDYLMHWGHYQLVIDMYERIQGGVVDQSLRQLCLGNMGTAYKNLGRVREGADCYEKALRIARKTNNRRDEAAWLWGLGNCNSNLGRLDEALECFEDALTIQHELCNHKGEEGVLSNLGNCYMDLGRMEEALECSQRALKISRKIGASRGEAVGFYRLANCYMQLGQSNEAIAFYEKAIRLGDEIGYVYVQHKARFNLACMFLFERNFESAHASIRAAREYNYPKNRAFLSAVQGVIEFIQGLHDEAAGSFEDAVSEADKIVVYSPRFYDALDAKGIAYAGAALCEEERRRSDYLLRLANESFCEARKICSAVGIVSKVLRILGELSKLDKQGALVSVLQSASGSRERPAYPRIGLEIDSPKSSEI